MPTPNNLLLAYYGDDFTGSTDALEMLSRAGATTVLFIAPPTPDQLAQFPNLHALGIAGMTRALAPDAMEAELRPAFIALKKLNPRHVHYKVCSTFDSSPTVGSIGRALEVGQSIFNAPYIPLVVGAPALGRYCLFGNLFARMGIGSAGEIHRLDRHPSMKNHPVTPADESDLRLHLVRQTTRSIALFDVLNVDLPEAEAQQALAALLATKPDIILFDLLYPTQLAKVGKLIDDSCETNQTLFSVGSSGIEMTLGAHWSQTHTLTPRTDWPSPGPAEPLLVLSGSCSPVTERQITTALHNGFAEVALNTPVLADNPDSQGPITAAAQWVASHLKAKRSVILHTSRGPDDPRIPESRRPGLSTSKLFGTALGAAARLALQTVSTKRIVIAGGDSSSYAARALGIEAVEMLAPLTPGAPICKAHAPGSPAHHLELIFKGGQVGSDTYFFQAAKGSL